MDRLSVLIVDNSPGVQRELESVLMDYDPKHARRSASTPEEALRIGRAFRPDVIIYDLPLSGAADGDAIGELKETLPGTRIIAISLYEHYGSAALEAGADEFVPKTANRSVLLAALERQTRSADDTSLP